MVSPCMHYNNALIKIVVRQTLYAYVLLECIKYTECSTELATEYYSF